MKPSGAIGALAAAWLAAGAAGAAPPPPARPAARPVEDGISRVERAVLEFVPEALSFERLYVEERDALAELNLERRFSDAELQFLLGQYGEAAALLFDLVEDPRFRMGDRLSTARYYLGEALYQQQNFRGARRYFRDLLLAGVGSELDLGLARFLELCARLDDFTGVDEVFAAVRAGEGGQRPVRLYGVAKGMFRRTDLPAEERLRRAEELFTALRGGRYEAKALYFLGVIAVQRGQLDAAAERFLAGLAASGPDETEFHELSQLALARIYHEQGKWKDALARYAKVAEKSPHHEEALYETAWTYARMGDDEAALRTADVLAALAADGPRAPEARLLQAYLCAKSGRHAEAGKRYGEVARQLGPIRDRVAAVLERPEDPAVYFDRLLQGRTGPVKAEELLPKEALAYADPGPAVDRAIGVSRDLVDSRLAIGEARQLATKLLEEIDRSALASVPGLADGMTRADATLAHVHEIERQLRGVELSLPGFRSAPALEALRAEEAALEGRGAAAPADLERVRREARFADVEAASRQLGRELEAVDARLAGIRTRLGDPRRPRGAAVAGAAVTLELEAELGRARQLRDEYRALRRRLADERAAAVGAAPDDLAWRHQELLSRERAVATGERAGLPRAVANRLDGIHRRLDEAKLRILAARRQLAELAVLRVAALREAVEAEARGLDAYEGELDIAAGQAGGLVGRMAVESVRKVAARLDELVVQADAGMADIAWMEKRRQSEAIRRLAGEKDRALGDLDADHAGEAGATP